MASKSKKAQSKGTFHAIKNPFVRVNGQTIRGMRDTTRITVVSESLPQLAEVSGKSLQKIADVIGNKQVKIDSTKTYYLAPFFDPKKNVSKTDEGSVIYFLPYMDSEPTVSKPTVVNVVL